MSPTSWHLTSFKPNLLKRNVHNMVCWIWSMKGLEWLLFLACFLLQCQYRSSHRRCSIKKVFLEISQKSQENTCARISCLIKVQAWGFRQNETLALMFSCDFCKISKNTIFYRTPHIAASANYLTIIIINGLKTYYILLNQSSGAVLSKRSKACNFIKKLALAQVFSCEFCEIFKNTFFYRHLRVTASNSLWILCLWLTDWKKYFLLKELISNLY